MTFSHELLSGSAITGGIEDVERALGLRGKGRTHVTSVDGSGSDDAAKMALLADIRAATRQRRRCTARPRAVGLPRTRARGAGRPRVRRSALRSGASAGGSDPGGPGDPPGPRPAASRCGEVAR